MNRSSQEHAVELILRRVRESGKVNLNRDLLTRFLLLTKVKVYNLTEVAIFESQRRFCTLLLLLLHSVSPVKEERRLLFCHPFLPSMTMIPVVFSFSF